MAQQSQDSRHPPRGGASPNLESLSDAELLTTALLGRYPAEAPAQVAAFQRLLDAHGSLPALVTSTSPTPPHPDSHPDQRHPSCDPLRIRALHQIHLRLCTQDLAPSRDPITTTQQAAALFIPHLAALTEESLMVLPITLEMMPMPLHTIAIGQQNHVRATPAQTFRPAVQSNAPALFLAHNHPQGTTEPSPHDWRFTKRMLRAAKLLDITLVDHIIIAGDRFRSMRQQNGVPFGDPAPSPKPVPPDENGS